MADHPAADGVGQVAVGAPQQRLDPAHQLAQPERLGQVVVGAELEADDLVDLVVAGGQDEDRRLRPGRAQPAEDLEAVHARQAHVEDDEVRRLVAWRSRGPPRRSGRRRPRSPPAGGRTGCRARPRARLRRSGSWRPSRRCYTGGATGRAPTGRGRASRGTLCGRFRAPRHSGPAGEPQPAPHDTDPEVPTPCPPPAPTLAAEHRDVTGKKVARLRRAGRLPAVVYGHGDRLRRTCRVDAHEFEQLRRHAGPNALVDLSVDGKKAPPGARPRRPGPPGQPPAAPRRPVPRPDDRGADGRRAARRRPATSPRRRAARRHAAPPDRVGPGPGAAGPPAAVDRVLDRVARRLRRRRSTSATWRSRPT